MNPNETIPVKVRELVLAVCTLGALSVPHFSEFLTAIGGPTEIMQAVAAVYVVYALFQRAYHFLHGIFALLVGAACALLVPGIVSAQEPIHLSMNSFASQSPSPAPMPEDTPDIGGLLVTYNLADLEPGMSRGAGFGFEADLRVPGAPAVSLVGHISKTNPRSFAGVGPRFSYVLGPVHIFGHYIFGSLESATAEPGGIDLRKGGGVMLPLGDRWEIRFGADHDGEVVHSVIGVGIRF